MLELHIGNKNYSSWSMRPWVLLRQAGIPFTEVMHRFDSFDADSGFKRTISAVSPDTASAMTSTVSVNISREPVAALREWASGRTVPAD